MEPKVLQIKKLFGKTFWLTLIFLLGFAGILEWISRQDFFQTSLTPPKMGSRHYQLGHKLTLLDKAVNGKSSIDCIMVGSSMTDVGFDPEAFQESYYKTTGQEIRCFNFGIDASSAVSTATLVDILIEDYQPRLLIFGTDARDYAVPSSDRDPVAVMDSPWIRYRLGNFSLGGWLLEQSYLYRYRQHLSRISRLKFANTLMSQTEFNLPILQNGHTPLSTVSTYINDPPDPENDSYEVVYYNRVYSSYQMLDENLAALERIMDYKNTGTEVIVVEMPVSDGLYYFFGNAEKDYRWFVDKVEELASLHQVPFWQTEPLDSIPDDGWSDYSHLNVTGAKIFSDWLGEQVGQAEEQGRISIFQP